MTDMSVEYVQHMGSDLSVVNAARVSFNKHKETMDETDEKLIAYLAQNNHFTPFTHASCTLRIKAPIFVARQLGKHQVGLSWNEVSRRYVDSDPEFYDPGEWRGRPVDGAKQGSSDAVITHLTDEEGGTLSVEDAVDYALEQSELLYRWMIDERVAPEQARMVLPQSMMTEWYWTGSLYAFARVCNLRLDPHSQKETREVAEMISDVMKSLFPVSWKALVA